MELFITILAYVDRENKRTATAVELSEGVAFPKNAVLAIAERLHTIADRLAMGPEKYLEPMNKDPHLAGIVELDKEPDVEH